MSKVKSGYGRGVEICVSWIHANNGEIPPRAVSAGGSCFVARASHEGHYLPGKLVEGFEHVYVSYGGEEITKNNYEVLVESSVLPHNSVEWQWTSGNNVPKGAIVAGTDDGEAVYIARGEIDGEMCVGKFYPPHGRAYLPYGGEEHSRDETEVLCCSDKHL